MEINFLKDEAFVADFNKHFPNGISEGEAERNYEALVDKFEEVDIMAALNLFNATIASGFSYNELLNEAHRFSDQPPEELQGILRTIILKYLGDNMLLPTETKRDFITEVIAEKFGVTSAGVTEEMRLELLEKPNTIYSIEDKPIEGWDNYFFNICRQVARHSKCLSRRIGAVLVKDKSVISTGYNGPPRGVPRCDKRWGLDPKFKNKYFSKVDTALDLTGKCPRYPLGAKSGEMLNICVAAHAEENSILDAARRGVKVKGATMYMTCGIPCTNCLIKIINAGIKEIVVTGITFYDENAEWLLNNSDVKVRLYNF